MVEQPLPKPPEAPSEPPKSERKYTVNASGKGVVVGDFNSVVQNFLADPHLRWYLLALAVVVIGTGAALYFLLRTTSNPRQWSGLWHVAVANFTVEGGTSADRSLGNGIAEVVTSTLTGEMREMTAANQVEIRGPAQVGKISGATAKERADAAGKVARAIDAHLVVYGTVKVSGLNYTITPEFYINPDPANLNPAEDREITGPYQLGAPQTVSGPVEAGFYQELRDRMGARLQVLAVMSMGIANFSTHRYDLALERFEEAGKLPWPADMTREMLYLMVGNANGKIGQVNFQAKQYDSAAARWQQAEASYQQAAQEFLKAHPGTALYPRASIGMGSVTYMRALLSFTRAGSAAGIDKDLLARSIQYYQDALNAPDKPEGADIAFNANMGLGQCYLLQTLAGELPDYTKATAAFQAVIDAYDQSKEPRLQELAGDAHGRLGLIHRLKGEKDAAIKEYQTAVDLLARYPKEQQIYQQSLEDLKK